MMQWIALASLLVGCKLNGAFACERDEQCRLGGNVGTCEPVGFCSFTDGTCASGSRFDSLAGGGFADQCVGDQPIPDAPDAAPPDPRCTTWSPPPRHFDACAIPMPNGDLTLVAANSPYTYDTTVGGGTLKDRDGVDLPIFSAALLQSAGPDMAVLSVENLGIEAGASMLVVGAKPLAIAAWSNATIAGAIDLGSQLGGRTGAGANSVGCQSTGVGVDGASGTGGGGGAGFGGQGGDGGDADANGTIRAGGLGGASLPAPTTVVGGCGGGNSGTDTVTSTLAVGGAGGGGLVLASRVQITVSGLVTSGGAGGAADVLTTGSYGGGGGGSGGLIGFDAPVVYLDGGVVTANGGGGGGGANIATTGSAGGDGRADETAAPGGAAGVAGTSGGAGSAAAGRDGTGVTGTPDGGGGGGGGAAGFILHWTASFSAVGAVISPPAGPGA